MMMLKTRQDLVRLVLGRQKKLEARKKDFEKKVNKLFKDTSLRVNDYLRNPKLYTKSQAFDLRVASKVLSDLDDILNEAGRDDLTRNYVTEFRGIENETKKYFESFDRKIKLGGASRQGLDAYIRFTETTLKNSVDRALQAPLQRAIFESTFGLRDRREVVREIDGIAKDLSTKQVTNLVNDTFQQYQRATLTEGAKEIGLEVYWYTGPDDNKTSDQCQELLDYNVHGVPGMFLLEEITQDLHPDLGGNPLIEGGHPGCRHDFSPITFDFAVTMGFEK